MGTNVLQITIQKQLFFKVINNIVYVVDFQLI